MKKAKTESQALMDEEYRRSASIDLLNNYIRGLQRKPNGDFKAEAIFYCEENNFEYLKAREAYDQDRAFEEEDERNKTSKK